MPTDTLFDFYENKKDTYSTEALYAIILKSKYKNLSECLRDFYIQLLINIDISIDSGIIFWNLSNSYLIDTTIVHIFYDHIVISYICYDTHMPIISIISLS